MTAKVALDTHANLVRKPAEGGTPIDTGYARANWILKIKERISQPFGQRPTAPGPSPSGKALFSDSSLQQSSLEAVRGGYRIDMGPIYIGNAAPYISELNEGSSTQAPQGFVQAAIVKAIVEDIHK